MGKISSLTLQKRHGGMWVALSRGGGKVYAASQTLAGLYQLLQKMGIDPVKKALITRVDRPDRSRAY